MKAEMEKVLWVTPENFNAQWDTQKCGFPSPAVSLNGIVSQLVAVLNAAGSEQLGTLKALRDISCHEGKLGAGVGFEPTTFRL